MRQNHSLVYGITEHFHPSGLLKVTLLHLEKFWPLREKQYILSGMNENYYESEGTRR